MQQLRIHADCFICARLVFLVVKLFAARDNRSCHQNHILDSLHKTIRNVFIVAKLHLWLSFQLTSHPADYWTLNKPVDFRGVFICHRIFVIVKENIASWLNLESYKLWAHLIQQNVPCAHICHTVKLKFKLEAFQLLVLTKVLVHQALMPF